MKWAFLLSNYQKRCNEKIQGGAMETKSNQTKENHITTDDLALSAYLKMKGYRLIKSDQRGTKNLFTFDLNGKKVQQIKVDSVNSEFINYYNEIKNLKKLM